MKTEAYTEKMEDYARPMVSKMGERVQDIQQRVGETARNLTHQADDYVHHHPWQTLAIVGIVACLVGFLAGRSRD